MGKHTRKYTRLALISILSAALAASFAWNAWAKYTQQHTEDAASKAAEFYFTSDYLTEEGAVYTLNAGTKTFTFQLRNYDDLKVSELDIGFQVKSNGDPVSGGTLSCSGKDTHEITLENLEGGCTYLITAIGENGYAQELSATVHVKPDRNNYHTETENHGEYVILTIWTENTTENLVVTIPGGLIPDWTDPALHGTAAGELFSVKLEPYQSRSFRFFTTDDYNAGSFTVAPSQPQKSSSAD